MGSRARLGFGLGVMAWGAVGLYISDQSEKWGMKASKEEKEVVNRMVPKITVVDNEKSR